MANLLISEEEKKQIFQSIRDMETKIDSFIEEAKDKIEECIKQINETKK